MFRTALKDLSHRKLRLVATGLAVILGVAFIAGTLVLTDTVNRSFNDLFSGVNRGTDVVVRSARTSKSTDDFGGQTVRSQIDATFAFAAAAVPGVRAVAPKVSGYAQMVNKQGDPIGNPRRGAPTLGVNWIADKKLNPFTLVEGRAPAAPDEVVIDRHSAGKGPFKVGDPITLLTQAGTVHAKVVGFVRFGTADSPGGASVTMFTLGEAERVLGTVGKVDAIALSSDGNISQTELAARVQRAVPSTLEAVTGAKVTKEDQDAIRKGLGFFSTALKAFGLISLVVGAFIIVNTFAIIVSQRTRELALLRALGASKRQVRASVLIEALVVGVLASLTGLGLGILTAAGMKSAMSALGVELPPGSLLVTSGTVVASLLLGTVVTLVSAVFPARRAAKVPPIAAMREVAVDDTGHSKGRLGAGVVLAGLAALLLAGGVSSHKVANTGLGAGVLLISFVVLGPVLAHLLGTVFGMPLAAIRGITGKVAQQNTIRNPRRTASTAAALMICLSFVVFITVFASSLKGSLHTTINNDFKGDYVIDTKGLVLPDDLVTKLDGVKELSAVVALKEVPLKTDATSRAMAANTAQLADVLDVHVKEGSLRAIGADGIALSSDKAKSNHLGLGSKLTASYVDGTSHTFTVRAIFDNNPAGSSAIIDHAAAVGASRQQGVDQILVKDAAGVTASRAHTAIKAVTNAYATAEVQTGKEFADGIGNRVNGLLGMVYALLALSIIIALIGMANTLGLSILERTRELGLLRAIGMARSQVRSTIRWEAVLIAAAGTALGLVLGIGGSVAVIKSLPASDGLTTVTIPGGQLVVAGIVGLTVGVIASIWPARRAAKLDVLAAIANE
jgi:putative ABC transport system permease protein